jgi:hypothetical protein
MSMHADDPARNLRHTHVPRSTSESLPSPYFLSEMTQTLLNRRLQMLCSLVWLLILEKELQFAMFVS